MTEKNFLKILLAKSNNENKIIKIKLVEIENRPSVSIQLKLMDKKIEQTVLENSNYKETISYKLVDFPADGSIEFNPTTIRNYLENIQ